MDANYRFSGALGELGDFAYFCGPPPNRQREIFVAESASRRGDTGSKSDNCGENGHRKGTRMMRKVSNLVSGAAMIGVVLISFWPQSVQFINGDAQAATADAYHQLILFGDIWEKIHNDYVEKPDEGKLVEAAINGMLSSLDPHSSYMDAKSFRDMQVQTKGEFGGLASR
jgi:hypothetical protein